MQTRRIMVQAYLVLFSIGAQVFGSFIAEPLAVLVHRNATHQTGIDELQGLGSYRHRRTYRQPQSIRPRSYRHRHLQPITLMRRRRRRNQISKVRPKLFHNLQILTETARR